MLILWAEVLKELLGILAKAVEIIKTVILNLGPPDVIELQLSEAFTTTSAGQDFWELKSKNIWRPKVGDHCIKIFMV